MGFRMKQSLHLRLRQQQLMTPQLQLAIRLLQLSSMDLQAEIQQQVDSNPLLELTPSEDSIEPSVESDSTDDQDFDDIHWSQMYTYPNKRSDFNEESRHYDALSSCPLSLKEHIKWQFELTPITDKDHVIGLTIIDAMDENGYLTLSLTELHQSLHSKSCPVTITEIEAVRHLIQRIDPIGCGSFTLAESLLIQLDELPPETKHLSVTKQIIGKDIELLGKHDYRQLMKIYHIDEVSLEEVLSIIHHLNPNPGFCINIDKTSQTIPDLFVKKHHDRWTVALNPQTLPPLAINHYYVSLLKKTKTKADSLFLKSNLQAAEWFLKSIQNRQETLLKLARYIVDYQQDFFVLGAKAMKPMNQRDVACALNMHESTVSRATTEKFIYTPRGLFELKYFFSSRLSTEKGQSCSSTAIRALIKQLIANEDHQMPLTDSKMMELINQQGIHVARRTVAKYRIMMGILPSHERKCLYC